jgi:hypothetical protein
VSNIDMTNIEEALPAEEANQEGGGAAQNTVQDVSQDVSQQGVPATNHPVFEFVTSGGEGTLVEHGQCSFIELIYVVLPNAIHHGHTLMVREAATIEVPHADVETGTQEEAEFAAARLREAHLHAKWAEMNGVDIPDACQAVIDAGEAAKTNAVHPVAGDNSGA